MLLLPTRQGYWLVWRTMSVASFLAAKQSHHQSNKTVHATRTGTERRDRSAGRRIGTPLVDPWWLIDRILRTFVIFMLCVVVGILIASVRPGQ